MTADASTPTGPNPSKSSTSDRAPRDGVSGAASRAGFTPTTIELAGALFSGLLVVLAFPAFGYEYGLDHLIWVALVPLLLVAFGAGARRGLLLGWVMGLIVEGAGFLWILMAIRTFGGVDRFVASVGFGLWLFFASSVWALFGAALGRCRRSHHLVVAVLLWIGLEVWFPRLWPWHVGGALFGRTTLVQCVDVVGASGLTAVVLLANCALASAVWVWQRQGARRVPLAFGGVAVLCIALALLYGQRRWRAVANLEAAASPVSLLFVQGFYKKREPLGGANASLEHYLQLTERWREENAERWRSTRLVLWPEGADRALFNGAAGGDIWRLGKFGHTPTHRQRLRQLVTSDGLAGAPALVFGATILDPGRPDRLSNASVYLRPGPESPQFYEKNIRVPFGEYVPFGGWMPGFLRAAIPILDLHAGRSNPRFELGDGGVGFRNLLCYEAVLPDYVRKAAADSDFLVNITEDYWYGNTAHIPQHVSVLQLRAIENRTPIFRCTNVGPSGVVEANGRFVGGDSIFSRAVFTGEGAALRLETQYQRWGHHLPTASLALAAALGALCLRRPRRSA